jgi:hypothetical protein
VRTAVPLRTFERPPLSKADVSCASKRIVTKSIDSVWCADGEAPDPPLDRGSYQTYTNLNINLKLGLFAVRTMAALVTGERANQRRPPECPV